MNQGDSIRPANPAAIETEAPRKRDNHTLFDDIFKLLMLKLSDRAMIQFLNGLFDKDHPIDSSIERKKTDSTDANYRARSADALFVVHSATGSYRYLIEAQINDDAEMALRVFEYGFRSSLEAKTRDGHSIVIVFPDARVLYWEATGRTPDTLTLRLQFADGRSFDYQVPTVKVDSYSMAEIQRQKLSILLPFYLLKLRRKVKQTATQVDRKMALMETYDLATRLFDAIDQATELSIMDDNDRLTVRDQLYVMFEQVYGIYPEAKEVTRMLHEKMQSEWERWRDEGREEGAEEALIRTARDMLDADVNIDLIAKFTRLSLEKIREIEAEMRKQKQ